MGQFNHFFLDLIFPPTCLGCSKFGEVFCQNCLSQIKQYQHQICPFCLKNNLSGQRHNKCKGNIKGLTAVWFYKGVIQQAIKQVKYRYYYAHFRKIIWLNLYFLKDSKYQQLHKFLKLKPIVVPIPLHQNKLRQRGFNQAEIVAKTVAKHYQLSFSKQILIRSKNTKPQSELKKKDRQTNVKKAFGPSQQILQAGPKPLKNKNILLVDDVWTTGATMQASGQVLKKLGAAEIWAFTLAR